MMFHTLGNIPSHLIISFQFEVLLMIKLAADGNHQQKPLIIITDGIQIFNALIFYCYHMR